MARRLLEFVELGKETSHHILEPTVGLAAFRPIVGDEHRPDRDRLDIDVGGDQAGIILSGQRSRQIVVVQLLCELYRQKPQTVLRLHCRERRDRLARDQDARCDVTGLQLFDRVGLPQIGFLHLDVEAAEDIARRQLRSAVDASEVHLLAGELLDRRYCGVGTDEDMHLLAEQPGDIDDPPVKGPKFIAASKRVEEVRLRDTEIDALEEAHISDVLPSILPHQGQDAEVFALVENRRKVMGNRQIGSVESAGDDGDGVGVQTFAKGAEVLFFRQPPIPILCVGRRDGKGCDEHHRGQYASYLKWPLGPPQTSPHLHPREAADLHYASLLTLLHMRSKPSPVAIASPALSFANVKLAALHADNYSVVKEVGSGVMRL